MTIGTLTDFYFSQYETLKIKGEYNSRVPGEYGLPGEYKTYTKEKFNKEWDGWLDMEVVDTSFQTHFTFMKAIHSKCKIPMLYFIYTNELTFGN